MARQPIVIDMRVPFEEADDAFDWWMRQYGRDPDGQFYDIARQLQPHVTVACFTRWRREFEHPKGTSVVVVAIGSSKDGPREGFCQKHGQPIAAGYCE